MASGLVRRRCSTRDGSDTPDPHGDVAQLEEHLLCKQGVVGSSPIVSTQVMPSGALNSDLALVGPTRQAGVRPRERHAERDSGHKVGPIASGSTDRCTTGLGDLRATTPPAPIRFAVLATYSICARARASRS